MASPSALLGPPEKQLDIFQAQALQQAQLPNSRVFYKQFFHENYVAIIQQLAFYFNFLKIIYFDCQRHSLEVWMFKKRK